MKRAVCSMVFFVSGCLGACSSDREKGPEYNRPVLSCDIDGMKACETGLFLTVRPQREPFMEFGAYDLQGSFDSSFSVLFSDANIDTGFSNPEKLSGVIVLNDNKSGKMPRAEFNVDTSGDDIRIWRSQESSIMATYDEETATIAFEWDLELYQTHPVVDDPPTRHEKGEAIAPIIVSCMKPIDTYTSVLDGQFETEFCQPWKRFHTKARFPDLQPIEYSDL